MIYICQDFTPQIHLSDEDFAVMTHGGKLLDEKGFLHIDQFEDIMREQMKHFVQRQLTNTLAIRPCTVLEEVQLTTMKAILQGQVNKWQNSLVTVRPILCHLMDHAPNFDPWPSLLFLFGLT